MDYRILGKTGLKVSVLGFGASAIGGVFHSVDEGEGIRAVHAALDCGINYFDVAPAYGGTRSEMVLGKALRGIPRREYFLSTKVGKYSDPGEYGRDTLDYSRDRIRSSLEESSTRLGTDYFDVVHLHDLEYLGRQHTEWALDEGLNSLLELKREGRIGAVGVGIYPLDLWRRILSGYEIDAALVHNHYCLNDDSLLTLLPLARARNIGIINGSPFASGLLTERGPADWHPAGAEERAVFRQAAEFCRRGDSSIAKLAFQFASRHPEIPMTLFSTSSRETLLQNVRWYGEPVDSDLLNGVREILRPLLNKQWNY
jgi:aryl-alcohol dehydrogenase-like predicted oxidoreductase